MIVEILWVLVMALWFLSSMPFPQTAQYPWASSWLAFFANLLLGIYIFLPGIRG